MPDTDGDNLSPELGQPLCEGQRSMLALMQGILEEILFMYLQTNDGIKLAAMIADVHNSIKDSLDIDDSIRDENRKLLRERGRMN